MIAEIQSEPADIVAFPVKSSDEVLEHLSPSSIKDYLGCSLRFYFRKVLGLPEAPSVNLHLGTCIHKGLQAFHLARWRDGDCSLDAVQAAFDKAFADNELELTEADSTKHRDKGHAMLKAYLESGHAVEQKPLGVEVMLQEHIPDISVPILGYIDLVIPGNVPVDFKTIAATPNVELEAFQHEAQMVAYQLLIESATDEPVQGREIVFLVKTKVPKVIVHRLPRANNGAVQRFLSMAEAVVDGVYHERWTPQPGMHCAWCSYRPQCAKWTGGGDG